MHPPSWCMPVRHTAHTLVICDLHVLQNSISGIVLRILYPWHLLRMINPLVVVLFVIVGHEHSMWNIALHVLQSGRRVPQSGEAVVGCGTPCCVGEASNVLSEQLILNGTVFLILSVETMLFGITHLRLLMVGAPSLDAHFLNLL